MADAKQSRSWRSDARSRRKRFISEVLTGLRIIWPILSGLLLLIVLLGIVVGSFEGWSVGDSIYFSFVTGLTIGYGELVPKLLLTRVLAMMIGATGILMTALIAAVAVKAFGNVDQRE